MFTDMYNHYSLACLSVIVFSILIDFPQYEFIASVFWSSVESFIAMIRMLDDEVRNTHLIIKE